MKMKSQLFLSIIFVFCISTQAQELVKWGVKFGFDIPTNRQNFSNLLQYNESINYNVGFQLRVGRRIYGNVGIDYYINKCTFDWKDTINPYQIIEFSYLAIPLQAGFQIVKTKTASVRILLGLQYRVLMRLSKNDINLYRADFQIHNLDLMGGVGLDLYSFTLDVGYRKNLYPVMPASSHYRDMIALSVGLIF